MTHRKPKQQRQSFIDRAVIVVAIIEPLLTLPQVYIIFKNQSAANISLFSWIGYNIMTAIWIWYAIAHKDKVILVYQGLFLIFNGLVTVGAIIYGGQWL